MTDATRRRRFSTNPNRRRWYARYRAARFARRFNPGVPDRPTRQEQVILSKPLLPLAFAN